MENTVTQKKILSGIKPSGKLTLGNYIGAMKNMVKLQDDFNCNYMVADLHALTEPKDPKELRANTLSVIALYLAVGLNPDKCTLFVQSHVTGHAELSWVLNCITGMGQLSRMTQFKDKSSKPGALINSGLFTYPVLMAADILLYNADLVPVGDDQRQHLEVTRDLAIKFNSTYSETFIVPEGYYPKAGARIMDLQNPLAKMGKSDLIESGKLVLTDDLSVMAKKIKSSVTDSGREVIFSESEEKAGVRNLMTIYSALTDLSMAQIEERYVGKGYGDFKGDLAEIVVESLRPIKEKHDDLIKNKDYLMQILKNGADQAQRTAYKTLSKVYRKIGLIEALR